MPGGKRKQIGRQRLRFREADRTCGRRALVRVDLGAVGERLPAGGNVERQRVARLQIRLIEAGKGQPRARRHEQRVHEVRVAVERRVAGGERDRDLVRALAQCAGASTSDVSDRDVDARLRGRRRSAWSGGGEKSSASGRGASAEREPDRRLAVDCASRLARNDEVQLVAEVADTPRALFGERQRHAADRGTRARAPSLPR